MPRSLRPLLAPLLLTLLLRPAAQANDGAALEARVVELAAHARARTVLLFGVIGLGSGAVVSPEGTVVTNAHVVAGARYAVAQWADGRSRLMRRRGVDYGRDLAVLEPVDPLPAPVPAFSLGTAPPRAGAWVLGCGYPGGLRTTSDPTVSLGTILPARAGSAAPGPGGILDYRKALRSDLAIFSGNSGGPMLDLEGRLVGINGAVDLERAVSLTIPVDAVRERLATLRDGVVVLPSGARLRPDRGLLRAFYRLTDDLARSLPQRVAEATRRAASIEDAAQRRVARVLPARAPSDELARRALGLPRQRALVRFLRSPAARALIAGDLLLTPLGGPFAVASASRVGERRHLELPGGRAERVATSPADDLALFRLPNAIRAPAFSDAPAAPVGALVYALDAEGPLAAGVVSVPPRPTSATLLARIQQGSGLPRGALALVERLARITGLRALRELAEQLRRAGEVRARFSAGTPPRSFRRVLSVDAPIPPSRLGAPVVDREGRLVGVAAGVAHHGTAYVVPVDRIRAAFRKTLGGTSSPRRRPRLF